MGVILPFSELRNEASLNLYILSVEQVIRNHIGTTEMLNATRKFCFLKNYFELSIMLTKEISFLS